MFFTVLGVDLKCAIGCRVALSEFDGSGHFAGAVGVNGLRVGNFQPKDLRLPAIKNPLLGMDAKGTKEQRRKGTKQREG
jgi:hypothetical protein